MMCFQYWAEPVDETSKALLAHQLREGAMYRRILATLENRARFLLGGLMRLTKEDRAPWRARIYVAHAQAVRDERAAASARGLTWGTYLAIEDALDQSQRTKARGAMLGTFAPRDEGIVGVHIQNREISARAVVGGEDKYVRIDPELVGKPTLRSRREGTAMGARRLNILSIRVGSKGPRGLEPVWARFYVLMNRPLPDASLKWVKLRCRRIGTTYRWQANFVVGAPCVGTPNPDRLPGVGIDLGWRKRADGIRIAYYADTEGRHGELVIPQHVIARDAKSDSLRRIRDQARNQIQAVLADLRTRLASRKAVSSIPPVEGTAVTPAWWRWTCGLAVGMALLTPTEAWFLEQTQFLHAWRKVSRLVWLHRQWRERRFAGDEDAFLLMDDYIRQDRHLFNWEAYNRRRLTAEVEGRVREFAVSLAKRYDMIAVEEAGIVSKLVQKQAEPEPRDEALRAVAAKRMHACSPASVREQIVRFGGKYGAKVMQIDPANTTKTCDACGQIRAPADPEQLVLGCEHCGHVQDQDHSAARTLLASGLVMALEGAATKGRTPRKMGARRTRKKAQVEIARDA